MDFISQIPLIVSYYTKNTPYEKEVEHLIASCQKFNLEHHVEGVKDLGSWEENCAYKPYFMKEMMERFQRPLLWVDADAVFFKPLSFDEWMFSDMSFYYAPALYNHNPCSAAFAGTVYVNATQGGLAGLDLWCHYTDEIRKAAGKTLAYVDQASLYYLMRSKPPFHFINLPVVYAKIFDWKITDLDPEEIVIEHNQASRRFRKRETHVH